MKKHVISSNLLPLDLWEMKYNLKKLVYLTKMAYVKKSIAKSNSILKEHNISFHINTSGNPKEAFHYYYNLRKLNSHLFLVNLLPNKIYTFCTPNT